MRTGFRVEKLRRDHLLDGFSSGREPLDRFLLRHAFTNQQANASQTYLGLHDDEVIGFYTLVVGEVAYDDAPERLTKGLARLAVAVTWQRRGIGAGLLKLSGRDRSR
jgi:GNAT superfamily N-acetyltransferase